MTVTILPWSLKGISDEARDYAKRAAADAGLPVGTWLSAVIRAAADADGIASDALPEADAGLAADLIPDLVAPPSGRGERGGNTIERAVQYVASYGNEPEGPVRDEDLIEDPEFLQAEIEALERRLADSESRTNEAIAPLVKEIERLRTRLERLRPQ
jgi:hypothetical protein